MKKLLFLLILTGVGVTSAVIAQDTSFVTDGLVSYWTFDRKHIAGRKVIDVWGENHAKIVGNPKRVKGKVREALQFDGIDDYVNLSPLGDFGTQVGTSTFEAWVKTSFRDNWSIIFKIDQVPCGSCWELVINASPGGRTYNFLRNGIYSQLCYRLDIGVCTSTGSGRVVPISDGKWHHIVLTIDLFEVNKEGRERRRVYIYKDSEISTTVFWNQSRLTVLRPFREPVYLGAGNNHGKAEGFFKGIIDEVRIYNRPLTEDEVIKNFKSRSAFAYNVEPIQKLSTVWGALKAR